MSAHMLAVRKIRSRRRAAVLLAMALMALAPIKVPAHALAPSLLSLEAAGGGIYEVTWKTPLQQVDGGRLRPVLPPACTSLGEPAATVEGTGLLRRWRIDCGESGLADRTIEVEGIAASKADVLLRIAMPEGVTLQQILTEAAPAFSVPVAQSWHGVFVQYLVLGFEHLLAGLDHVLFVVGLTLLVGMRRSLVWAITSFTIGHSVTLSAAVLGYVQFPQTLAEIFIALTILVTFAGVLRPVAGSLLRRWSGVVAFGFGLLHGLGFAGALAEVGLPQADIPLALLAFNIGIELGQLLLIGVLLTVMLVAQRRVWQAIGRLGWVPVYAAGTLSGFWFWQRLLG